MPQAAEDHTRARQARAAFPCLLEDTSVVVLRSAATVALQSTGSGPVTGCRRQTRRRSATGLRRRSHRALGVCGATGWQAIGSRRERWESAGALHARM